ncbi:hypothetical protein [Salinicola sp. NYA28a]
MAHFDDMHRGAKLVEFGKRFMRCRAREDMAMSIDDDPTSAFD